MTDIYVFNIDPMGAPRMSQRDRFKPSKAVKKYIAFQKQVKEQANTLRFRMSDTLDIIFYIAMPASWSNKKKMIMAGKPHKSKPDLDNLVKAFVDSYYYEKGKKTSEDSTIYRLNAQKYWDFTGKIEIHGLY